MDESAVSGDRAVSAGTGSWAHVGAGRRRTETISTTSTAIEKALTSVSRLGRLHEGPVEESPAYATGGVGWGKPVSAPLRMGWAGRNGPHSGQARHKPQVPEVVGGERIRDGDRDSRHARRQVSWLVGGLRYGAEKKRSTCALSRMHLPVTASSLWRTTCAKQWCIGGSARRPTYSCGYSPRLSSVENGIDREALGAPQVDVPPSHPVHWCSLFILLGQAVAGTRGVCERTSDFKYSPM